VEERKEDRHGDRQEGGVDSRDDAVESHRPSGVPGGGPEQGVGGNGPGESPRAGTR